MEEEGKEAPNEWRLGQEYEYELIKRSTGCESNTPSQVGPEYVYNRGIQKDKIQKSERKGEATG